MRAVTWFYEVRQIGTWRPVKVPDRPATKNVNGQDRLVSVNGVGNPVRSVTEVPPYFEHLTLSQMAECFGAEGRFQRS